MDLLMRSKGYLSNSDILACGEAIRSARWRVNHFGAWDASFRDQLACFGISVAAVRNVSAVCIPYLGRLGG